jgi:hypothetical protein
LLIVAIGVVGAAAFINYRTYFDDYGQSDPVYHSTSRVETWAAREVLRLDDGYDINLAPLGIDPVVVQRIVERHATYETFDAADDLPPPATSAQEDLAFVVTGQDYPESQAAPILNTLRALYPQGHVDREEHDPAGKLVGVTYLVPRP